MEPGLFRYVMSGEPVEKFIPSGGGRRDWPVIEQIFFDLLRVARGNVSTRARDAFERLGMGDHYLAQLGRRRWGLRAGAAEKLGPMGSQKATPRLTRTTA